jgi:hypothetical protein
MEHRLNSYCKGLLEVKILRIPKVCPEGKPIKVNDAQQMLSSLQVPEGIAAYVDAICNSRVEYLHRTVRDYLARPNIKAQLDEWSASNFHPDLSLASAFLISLKTIDSITITRSKFWGPINLCLAYTARIEKRTASSPTALLNELDRVACNLSLSRTGDNQTDWRSIAKVPMRDSAPLAKHTCVDRDHRGTILPRTGPAMQLIQLRPDHPTNPPVVGSGTHWLASPLKCINPIRHNSPIFEEQLPPISLPEMLLRKGADPHASPVPNLSAWQFVLQNFHGASGTYAAPGTYWVDLLSGFTEWSVDSRQSIPADVWALIKRYLPDTAKALRVKIYKHRVTGIMRWLSSLHQSS